MQLKVDSTAVKGGYNFWTNPVWTLRQMPIPPNSADTYFRYSADPTYLDNRQPMNLYVGAVHMHNLGKRGSVTVERANGTTECRLRDDSWDFHWQGGVMLKQPIRVNPGDKVAVDCHFANTTPALVNWGEGTADDMCLGVIMWGPAR